MKILCRTTIALCVFLAVVFLTAGTAAATDTNPADFTIRTDLRTIYVTPCSTDVQTCWFWDFGQSEEGDCCEGYDSPIDSQTFTYNAAGTYKVTLYVGEGMYYHVTKQIDICDGSTPGNGDTEDTGGTVDPIQDVCDSSTPGTEDTEDSGEDITP